MYVCTRPLHPAPATTIIFLKIIANQQQTQSINQSISLDFYGGLSSRLPLGPLVTK